MPRLSLIPALIIAAACGPRHVVARATPAVPPELAALAETYQSLQPEVEDSHGWSDTDRCDALLWASLRAAAGVDGVDVGSAETSGGRWLRRPADLPECFASGQSDSTVSRDMLLGVLWWAWTAGDAGVVSRLWAYGLPRGWSMGSGSPGAVILSPNMLGLFARACVALHASCPGAALVATITPQVYTDSPQGYDRHLEVLQILLRGEMDGSLPAPLVTRLRKQLDEQPDNPLFLVAVAIWGGGTLDDLPARLLQWPQDRLPTAADWCSDWRVEAESGSSGSLPCQDTAADGSPIGVPRKHSGGEILFLRRLLRGRP